MSYDNIPKDRDTSYYLWEILFQCRLPETATVTELEYRVRGMPTTGNPEMDKDIGGQLKLMWLPIHQMVEYHRVGVPVRLVKVSDAEVIYGYVQSHLEAWLNRVQTSFNDREVPVDDLVALDNFANDVYSHARYSTKSALLENSLSRAIMNLGAFSLQPRHAISKTPTVEEVAEIDKQKRRSFVSAFTDSRSTIINLNRRDDGT
jgi:hypothetical protein